eukprot:TRINITY_DN2887_c0_g2_i1.p1 TRINITY_DN2887_c0_g2~~TRINITY_DN2887_c0_g2_i1.p1  ORF type:complete len:302 (+),score=55.41 TRINITY_DN2887_c0_g2_i1:28-906(+)
MIIDLKKILTTERKEFRSFLQSRMSAENLDFWITCKKFLRNMNIKKASLIYDEFVDINGMRPINISDDLRDDMYDAIQQEDDTRVRGCIKKCMKEIEYHMATNFLGDYNQRVKGVNEDVFVKKNRTLRARNSALPKKVRKGSSDSLTRPLRHMTGMKFSKSTDIGRMREEEERLEELRLCDGFGTCLDKPPILASFRDYLKKIFLEKYLSLFFHLLYCDSVRRLPDQKILKKFKKRTLNPEFDGMVHSLLEEVIENKQDENAYIDLDTIITLLSSSLNIHFHEFKNKLLNTP